MIEVYFNRDFSFVGLKCSGIRFERLREISIVGEFVSFDFLVAPGIFSIYYSKCLFLYFKGKCFNLMGGGPYDT